MVCRGASLSAWLIILLMAVGVSGCSGGRFTTDIRHQQDFQQVTPLVSLSANLKLSFRIPERHGSMHGVLLYQPKDRLRMVLLSPFGTTLADLLLQQQLLTIAYPAEGVAFRGAAHDLPKGMEREIWQAVDWLLKADKTSSLADGSWQVGQEKVEVRNSQVVVRERSNGEMLRFERFEYHDGIPWPARIIYTDTDERKVTMTFEDIELNQPVDEAAWLISLEGYRLLPLSALNRGSIK